MSAGNLHRRLERLERERPEEHVRYVWWEPGQPEPQAAPGEQLVIITWDHDGQPEEERR